MRYFYNAIFKNLLVVQLINFVFFFKYHLFKYKSEKIFYSKYCPSEAVTFFPHLSGNLWIPSQKKLLNFCAEKVIKQFFNTFNIGEQYSRKVILHRPKQVVFRSSFVWAIRRVRLNFPSDIFQIIFDRYCNMWSSIVMMENQFLVSGRPFRPFFGYF